MLKIKKIFSAFVGAVMAANALVIMPFSAFADDNTAHTYTYDGYEVSCDVTNSWGNTEIVSVTLSNTGDSAIENWMLYFDPNGQAYNPVNAQNKQTSAGTTYFKNSGYNATVNPNSSVSFSYMIDDCEDLPNEFTLCQTRVAKESGYQVSLQVNQTWGDSFNGDIIIQNNTAEPIEAWELTVDTNFTITEITNSWAATVTELDSYKYMLKGTYTGYIPANSSVSLGFNGVKSGDPIVTDYSLTEVVVDENIIDNFDWIDWENMDDSDGDGIPDEIESEIGTNPLDSDTDGDGLPDGYEFFTTGSDPTNANSLDASISDGAFDSDQDGLSNYEEYQLGTNPNRADSDYDELSDGDEENIYGTDPLNPDTDEDGLFDGDEIALGLNPLVADSDGDGIPDNEELFNQSQIFDANEDDAVVQQIDVAFEGTGYINSTTSVTSVMDVDWMCSNVVGLIGDPYDISSNSTITEGTITFHVAAGVLGDSSFNDLVVLWYNEAEQRFEEMETLRNNSASTLSVTVTHFSKYLIVDCNEWYAAWNENYYPSSNIDLHTAITIDCSSSMNSNDPNRCRVDAAKGFVNVMRDNDMASVTLFASHVSTQSLGTLTKDKDLLKETIDNVTSLGVTNYEEALQHSINSLDVNNNTSSENIIIFLSDGYPTDDSGYAIDPSDFDYSVVDTAAAAGIKIYTIGLTDNVCETILEEMADRTGGEYFYANTAEELVPYFLNINVTEKYDTTTDTDGDGIPDLFETYGMPVANGYVLFSDSQLNDTDGDGLKDGEEVSVMYVNDNEDTKLAAQYVSEYYPDIEVNACGGIYFKMISDPENTDTDGDLDLDNADPDPTTYQLNGYFAQKMGELQEAAREYYGNSYNYNINDGYNGCKDLWLCSYYVRQFNKNYTTWKWNFMAGSDTEFVTYISQNNPNLKDYFTNTKEIYVNSEGQTLDLYHCFATLSSLMDNKTWQWARDLTGWAGDLQTVINQAYKKTYTENEYENIGLALYNLMGNDSYNFGLKDLYGDIDAVNIEALIRSGNNKIELLLNQYYSLDEIERNENFISNASITTNSITYYIASDKQFITCTLTDADENLCILAFKNYLQDTLEVQIS